MRRDERIADFDKQVNDPVWWTMSARPLFTAANALIKEYGEAQEEIQLAQSGQLPDEAEWLVIALFLEGRGLECLLKSLCAKIGVVLGAKGTLRIKTHNLILLSNHAEFKLNRNERALFQRMNKIITWGLYPVPTSFSDWRVPVKGTKGPIFPD